MNKTTKTIFSIFIFTLLPILIFAYYFPPQEEETRIPTEVTYQGVVFGQYSDSAELEANLINKLTEQGLEGKEINFTLEAQDISATTNEQGIANQSLILSQGSGDYTILTIFPGDEYFSGSSDAASFEILKEDSSLDYTGPISAPSGSTITLSAELSEIDEEIGDLEGKRIIFQIAGQEFTATTDSQGIAEVETTLSGVPAGTYSLTCEFEGDALYLSSSDSLNVEVTGNSGGSGGGGCFIATAAFGSSLSSEIQTLREFRDQYLLTNKLGQHFVSGYYEYSPGLAGYIEKKENLRKIIRIGLKPLIELSEILIY